MDQVEMNLTEGDKEITLPSNSELRGILRTANWGAPQPDPEDTWAVVEYEKGRECREQARATLRELYGSDMLAAVAAGYAVAERSEELAGITAAEVCEAWEKRVEQAQAAYDAFPAILVARIKLGESPEAQYAEHERLRQTLNSAWNGTDAASRSDLRKLRDGYQAALAEIRPMGGTLELDGDSRPEAAAAVQRGAQYYPTEWTQTSNEGLKIYAYVVEGRGRYRAFGEGVTTVLSHKVMTMDWPPERTPEPNPYGEWVPTGEVTEGGLVRYRSERWEVAQPGTQIPPALAGEYQEWIHPVTGERHMRRPELVARKVYKAASGIAIGNYRPPAIEGAGAMDDVAIHELAHRYEEQVASITDMENEFLEARTRLFDGTREQLVEWSGSMVRPDHFASPYTGRDPYVTGATEVLATGVQSLFGGALGGQIGLHGHKKDLHMRAFVLGVLATASGRKGEEH
ncbi:hypothetical protein RM50_04255 [Pseudarthrobacter phenanthrenivorans]|uniref:Uncharacterized protein n=1 Tax=Pseudarthrobacter phenanthrenivorans TaxID=361575 RepID=A0A0B4DW57_PSEPS|nr:hypothetical protein RM50_04255 [Pseudarthrobacter phenanthrenivorans]